MDPETTKKLNKLEKRAADLEKELNDIQLQLEDLRVQEPNTTLKVGDRVTINSGVRTAQGVQFEQGSIVAFTKHRVKVQVGSAIKIRAAHNVQLVKRKHHGQRKTTQEEDR